MTRFLGFVCLLRFLFYYELAVDKNKHPTLKSDCTSCTILTTPISKTAWGYVYMCGIFIKLYVVYNVLHVIFDTEINHCYLFVMYMITIVGLVTAFGAVLPLSPGPPDVGNRIFACRIINR